MQKSAKDLAGIQKKGVRLLGFMRLSKLVCLLQKKKLHIGILSMRPLVKEFL